MPHPDSTSQTAGVFTARRCADNVAGTALHIIVIMVLLAVMNSLFQCCWSRHFQSCNGQALEASIIDYGVKLVLVDSIAALARSEFSRDKIVDRQQVLGKRHKQVPVFSQPSPHVAITPQPGVILPCGGAGQGGYPMVCQLGNYKRGSCIALCTATASLGTNSANNRVDIS